MSGVLGVLSGEGRAKRWIALGSIHSPQLKPRNFNNFTAQNVRPLSSLRNLLAHPHRYLLLAVGLLLLPALLVNLGLLAFTGDEGIRSLVALEMGISGNYVTPTLFGEFYYNKPPLYNWLLLAIFKFTGRTDEFIARLPTVFFLLAYATTIWFCLKKHLSTNQPLPITPVLNGQFPILNSLALITCGRILFWDSMLALIDTCFSWLMYTLFMLVFTEGEKGRYGRLFRLAYLLAGVGFLLKGLPAVVFLGIALLTYFFWVKQGRKLLSWAHLSGMAVFGLVVGSYYVLYAQQNGLSTVFNTLFHESAKRTFVEHGLVKTVLHLFTFPFEMGYHFLPWTLLAVFLFLKKTPQFLHENRFIAWNLLVFLTTVLPYWISVEVYPRYLLMHVPLVFTVLFYLYDRFKAVGDKTVRWVEGIFQLGCWLLLAASFAPLWWKAVADVPQLYWKTSFLVISTALLTWLYRRWKAQRMMVFVAIMLVARIGFNWFVLPVRLGVDCNTAVRQSAMEAVRLAEGRPIHVYKNSLAFQPVTGYYFTRETGKVLRSQYEVFDKEACYLMDTTLYGRPHKTLSKVKILWKCGELCFVEIKE